MVADAEALAARLAETVLKITAKAEEGVSSVRLPLPIWQKLSELNRLRIIEVDRKSISVDPVKTIGAYEASVKIYKGIGATIKFEVVAEE